MTLIKMYLTYVERFSENRKREICRFYRCSLTWARATREDSLTLPKGKSNFSAFSAWEHHILAPFPFCQHLLLNFIFAMVVSRVISSKINSENVVSPTI